MKSEELCLRVGMTIAQLRKQILKKERGEFAKELQITKSRLGGIEKGTKHVSLTLLHRIVSKMGFTVIELITIAEKRDDIPYQGLIKNNNKINA